MPDADDAVALVLTFGEALVGYAGRGADLRAAEEFTRFLGGADLNVAVGLSRLGTATRWASTLGSDAHGDWIVDQVTGLGIDTRVVRAAGSTALMFKAGGGASDPEVLQVRADTAFARHADDLLAEPDRLFAGVAHLHLTGIALGVSAVARRTALGLLDLAAAKGVTVSFDPNLRLNLWPDVDEMRQVINSVAARCAVVLPGLAEGRLLTGADDAAGIAEHYLQAGTGEVVIKLGADGAEAWSGSAHARSRPFRVDVVDTVGAGDGFAAGYLDALLRGADLQTRIDQAAAVGALVTTRPGDAAAMPTRSAVDALLAVDHHAG